jgi:hypothetical protein
MWDAAVSEHIYTYIIAIQEISFEAGVHLRPTQTAAALQVIESNYGQQKSRYETTANARGMHCRGLDWVSLGAMHFKRRD